MKIYFKSNKDPFCIDNKLFKLKLKKIHDREMKAPNRRIAAVYGNFFHLKYLT